MTPAAAHLVSARRRSPVRRLDREAAFRAAARRVAAGRTCEVDEPRDDRVTVWRWGPRRGDWAAREA